MTGKYQIILISDSTGETLGRIFLAIQSQFASFEYDKKEFVFIRTQQQIEKIIKEAENIESDSNQILDFTKNLKNADEEMKLIVIESLWEIIYSDKESDMYEANLMRRLTGLLYLDPKKVGEIKERINLKLK